MSNRCWHTAEWDSSKTFVQQFSVLAAGLQINCEVFLKIRIELKMFKTRANTVNMYASCTSTTHARQLSTHFEHGKTFWKDPQDCSPIRPCECYLCYTSSCDVAVGSFFPLKVPFSILVALKNCTSSSVCLKAGTQSGSTFYRLLSKAGLPTDELFGDLPSTNGRRLI